MNISIYTDADKNDWDAFVRDAKNSHFFFQRDYIEYHKNRFKDFSLLIRNDKGALIAVLPANLNDGTLYSHQGLTFGGLIVLDSMRTELMLCIFDALIEFLKTHKIKRLLYKCIPYIYHKKPAEEDRYALFLNDATLVRRDVTSVVYLGEDIKYSKGRKWTINKAKKEGLTLCESSDLASFWTILEDVLESEHNVKPVHTLDEISILISRFPSNIRLFLASSDHLPVSGALVFDNGAIVHTQYLANSNKGRKIGALDLLIDYLIKDIFKSRKYFDFGTSNEAEGKHLNTGLIAQKEGFGARSVAHDFYEIVIK